MHSYNKLYAIMPRLHMKSHSVCHQSVNNQLKNPKNNKKKYATLWNKSLSIVKNEQFCLYFPNCTICLHCEGDVLLVTHKNYVYSHLCYNVFFFFLPQLYLLPFLQLLVSEFFQASEFFLTPH